MSRYAETTLGIATGFYHEALGVFKDTLDEISGLTPPGHLSESHNNFVASFGEVLQLAQQQVDNMKDADTDIRNRADFEAVINSPESGPLDPELAQQA